MFICLFTLKDLQIDTSVQRPTHSREGGKTRSNWIEYMFAIFALLLFSLLLLITTLLVVQKKKVLSKRCHLLCCHSHTGFFVGVCRRGATCRAESSNSIRRTCSVWGPDGWLTWLWPKLKLVCNNKSTK